MQQSRLSPVNPDRTELKPWRKANGDTPFHVYWLRTPFPMRAALRTWTCRFFDAFSEIARAKWNLSPQNFFKVQAISPPVSARFQASARDYVPLLGLAREWGERPNAVPDAEYLSGLQQGRSAFKPEDTMPDYCYWLSQQQAAEQRSFFLGFGGLTTAYVKNGPDCEELSNALAQRLRSDASVRRPQMGRNSPGAQQIARRMQMPFLRKSKEVFGAGLEGDPQFAGLHFILPSFGSAEIFSRAEEVAQCLSIFEIYVQERAADGGILLLSGHDCDDALVNALAATAEEEPHSASEAWSFSQPLEAR